MTERFDEDGISPANEESSLEDSGAQGSAEHYNLPVPLAGLQTNKAEDALDPLQEFVQQIRETLPFGYDVDEEEQCPSSNDLEQAA